MGLHIADLADVLVAGSAEVLGLVGFLSALARITERSTPLPAAPLAVLMDFPPTYRRRGS